MKNFTRIELFVVIACIAILTALIVAATSTTKVQSATSSCYFNLFFIKGAYDNFYLAHDADPIDVSTNNGGTKEYGITNISAVVQFRCLMKATGKTAYLTCPSDNRYNAKHLDLLSNTNISYAINVSAINRLPGGYIEAADRNIVTKSNTLALIAPDVGVGWNFLGGLHGNRGNVIMPGGAVFDLDTQELLNAIKDERYSTNLMAIP